MNSEAVHSLCSTDSTECMIDHLTTMQRQPSRILFYLLLLLLNHCPYTIQHSSSNITKGCRRFVGSNGLLYWFYLSFATIDSASSNRSKMINDSKNLNLNFTIEYFMTKNYQTHFRQIIFFLFPFFFLVIIFLTNFIVYYPRRIVYMRKKIE